VGRTTQRGRAFRGTEARCTGIKQTRKRQLVSLSIGVRPWAHFALRTSQPVPTAHHVHHASHAYKNLPPHSQGAQPLEGASKDARIHTARMQQSQIAASL
jgi:hypothetical protein